MTMSVVGLSIDCADAAALAGFWSEVLGRPVNPGADAERAAIDATDPEGNEFDLIGAAAPASREDH